MTMHHKEKAFQMTPSIQLPSKPRSVPRLVQADGNLVPDSSSPEDFLEALCLSFGVADPTWCLSLLNSAVNAVPAREDGRAQVANDVLSSVLAIAPEDGVEAMLAIQAAVTHQHVMTFLGKATASNLTGMAEERLRMAARLMKLFSLQIQTLGKHRHQGHQTVRVEKHVHVHGGQNIFADVSEGGHA